MTVKLALRQAQKGLQHAVGVHGTIIITILGCCEDDGLLQHVSGWKGKDTYERENILVDAEARGLTASSALCALGLSSLTAWLVLCVWLVSWVLQDSSQVLKGASEEVHCAP